MPGHRTLRGDGALNIEQQNQVLHMIKSGARQKEAAEHFGVSKNTIAGVWARHGEPGTRREPTTLGQRLDALHAKLDRVLAETTGIGRIPESERIPPMTKPERDAEFDRLYMAPSDAAVANIASLTAALAAVLAGHHAPLQGAALADCLAMWLAGHHVAGNERATRKMRAELLAMHCSLVRNLVPENARQIGTTP